ncbi:MAG: tRNA-dihydrouridine synthase [Atopobiaceae bacterium]|nr:tRNA-dihydrouridine synthase [Atopobiaceae bacterium]
MDVLARYAEGAGLCAELRAFPARGSLRERFAQNPLLMAPMAGVSDAAYRLMARAGGAALAYSEMVSVAGLHYGSDKTWELVKPQSAEPDIAVQLFGAEPAQFREAAAAVAKRVGQKLVLIDINMACPMPKVTKNGSGAALLDNPQRAEAIVAACREGLTDAGMDVPVTAKIRRGYRLGEEVAPEFARVLEEAGVDAVAVHGRYANQLYRGEASWDVVRRVSEAVDVSVIGSGDVRDHAMALRMLEETGCAAVMVARGTYGNPWVFAGYEPTAEERLAAFACHVRLLEATGAHMARARSLAGWYFKGMPGAARLRGEAVRCNTCKEFLALIDRASE